MKHYVYVYLDPRKPGKYKYQDLILDFEPFYVGKGKSDRWKPHLHIANKYLINKINKIGQKNIIIKFIHQNILESEANKYETQLINIIGRLDKKQGPLINMTDGGEGNSGRIFSEEHRKKLSIANIGNYHPGYWTGKKLPEDIRKKISEKHKGKIPWNKGKKGVQKGHIISQEEKQNISLKNSGCNNGMASLKKEEVLLIKKLYNEGKSNKYIESITKIRYGTIYGITSNRTYKNIGENNE